MKKLLSIIFLSAFVFAVIGCGDGGTNEVQSSTPQGGGTETKTVVDPKNTNRQMSTSAETGTE